MRWSTFLRLHAQGIIACDFLLVVTATFRLLYVFVSVKKLGIRVLKSPPRSPMANAICERVIGTIRRECLDWLIPLSASHLRSLLKAPITMPGARTWRSVRVFPIRLQERYYSSTRNLGIIWGRERWCAPARCRAACITNICSRAHWADGEFARHRSA